MLISQYTIETTATPAQIWRVWEDVETWKTWDREIEYSHINGSFAQGTTGSLKMHNSPVLKTEITQCEPLRMYVFEAKLFLARSVSTSSIEQIANKTLVTFKNEICGPLAFFYILLIGGKIKDKMPGEMQRMLNKAKNTHARK